MNARNTMNAPKKLLVAGIAAAGIALASGSALAWRGGDRAERIVERVSERLELDDNQRAALVTLVDEMSETRTLMRGGDGGELRTRVESLLTADTLDQGAALALIEERTAAVQAQAPTLVAAAAVFLDGLTPEQRSEIGAFLERGGRHGGRDERDDRRD